MEPWCQAGKCPIRALEYHSTVTKTAHHSRVLALSVKTSSHTFSGNKHVFSITKLSKGSGSKPPCNEVRHLFVVESSCDYWLWLSPFDVHDVTLLSIQPSWISIHTDTDCGFSSLLGDGRRWSLWLLHVLFSHPPFNPHPAPVQPWSSLTPSERKLKARVQAELSPLVRSARQARGCWWC